jgi:hypothetical protein
MGVYTVLQFPIIVSVCHQQSFLDDGRDPVIYFTFFGLLSLVIVISAQWTYANIVLIVSAIQSLPQIALTLRNPDSTRISLSLVTSQTLLLVPQHYC